MKPKCSYKVEYLLESCYQTINGGGEEKTKRLHSQANIHTPLYSIYWMLAIKFIYGVIYPLLNPGLGIKTRIRLCAFYSEGGGWNYRAIGIVIYTKNHFALRLHAKMAMPDSQRYPWSYKLGLIKYNLENWLFFMSFLFKWLAHFYFRRT